jgi:hypothetical protein
MLTEHDIRDRIWVGGLGGVKGEKVVERHEDGGMVVPRAGLGWSEDRYWRSATPPAVTGSPSARGTSTVRGTSKPLVIPPLAGPWLPVTIQANMHLPPQ